MERVITVTVRFSHGADDGWTVEDSAGEMAELTANTGVELVDNIICLRDKPTASLLIGSGKAEELALICAAENVDTVIFNKDLTGTQQRNLEDIIGKRVIDRTQLILDIFARHASSGEGKAQVELAQLEYMLPRLAGRGKLLSRPGGGIGTSGPGETKLETDRRRIRKRIDSLKRDLRELNSHRQLLRKKRKEKELPLVALVGYTNAGKSTLLNALCNAGQKVQNALFTTLDPLSKSLQLPCGENVVLTDTVGFLHDLPHNLIEAFKATLEETAHADLLVHVIDCNHHLAYEHARSARQVLEQIGAQDIPVVTALNKLDLLEDKSWLAALQADMPRPVAISAKLGTNLDKLLAEIEKEFKGRMTRVELLIPHSLMHMLDQFYRHGKVESVEYLAEGVKVKGNLPVVEAKRMQDACAGREK
ncbi:MAG: GTPase HflX [Candidatus Omnitrophica bacterium]|jgi:GTP-binding protein HflX|nr:GTPase HflX [Candidatus Omnitrophota bacterium]